MIKSVVEILMEEIHEMELLYGNVVLGVSIVRKDKKTAGSPAIPPPYVATANLHPGIDIQGYGKNPEEALQYLKAGIIGQYAPGYQQEDDFLDLPIYAELDHFSRLDLGRVHVHIPESIEQKHPCGCKISVGLHINHRDGNGDISVTPQYSWCKTHLQAYAMRRLLGHERKVAHEWLRDSSLSAYTILELADRITDINKALGNDGDD